MKKKFLGIAKSGDIYAEGVPMYFSELLRYKFGDLIQEEIDRYVKEMKLDKKAPKLKFKLYNINVCVYKKEKKRNKK